VQRVLFVCECDDGQEKGCVIHTSQPLTVVVRSWIRWDFIKAPIGRFRVCVGTTILLSVAGEFRKHMWWGSQCS